MPASYVYNGTEVKLTGRKAFRKLRTKTTYIYEITPLTNEDGSWKKWVQLTELYEITDNNKENNNNEREIP